MNKVDKRKTYNIINIILSVIFAIIILFEVVVWIITFINDNSTINIYGSKPYIVKYDDSVYGFKYGDLAIAKELKNNSEYVNNTGIVYKTSYKNNNKAVILRQQDFEQIKSNSLSRYEGKYKHSIKKLGKVILFFKELYAVIMTIIIVALICVIIFLLRKNSKEELSKEYIRNRRIKDILIILFITTTYVSIFFIGELVENSGYEIIKDNTNNNLLDNTANNVIENNTIENNTVENNINETIQNGTTNTGKTNINTGKQNGNENNSQNGSQNSGENDNNKPNENVPVDTGIDFEVTEKEKTWNQLQELSIFNNKYFNGQNKIAPGVSGSYEFKVHNKSKYNMRYKVKFSENNNYNINLQYKIKRNGQYLNTEYARIQNLNFDSISLNSYGTDVYTIEWKWIDSSNDTEIGNNAENVVYNLMINVTGEKE